ncbi:hypothetical protein K437DRAFT_222453 [Tilletiaria anomala UBC 951]|uniref:Vacuolar import and degradation protein n=1 Tax=Tilletiaria anomala (strain ATCC 24038 / CBS 436.72 / UBC 951) TaxID=1037660 RepID=A0A066W4M9_TILAU|nr:uncharacterized protein K437DRAFT_222453 [Tilletiaria anomala UBC 951]KDN48892.1 hypothetical protein K437DRAFT_222453 [Tilletiaria anomala UBC 951]
MREDATKEEGEGIAKHTSWFNVRKPDPLPELSRKRLPPQGIGCLYPGALFTGTQRSGRSTYDVSVRIVNVDLPSSMLCGYLNIRGLTEDWPELTTYFDAEIIGSKHGFITGKWGATEADDQKHWSRFLPFRPLKPALVKPALTFNHLNKPYVFMRWKERFLVPDHRVRERDINGASYAGFYYVCVELGDDNLSRYFTSPSSSSAAAAGSSPPTSPGVQLRRPQSQTRGRLSDAHTSGYWTTVGAAPPAHGNVTVSMSGYYFHENSEPYQQLSLAHVPERSSSYFELR